jgi:hypothetical protein
VRSHPEISKVKRHLPGIAARRYEMRAAKRGQEVVKREFVGEVEDREAQIGLPLVRVKDVVPTYGHVEEVAWRDPRRIQIVVLRARSGNSHQRRR